MRIPGWVRPAALIVTGTALLWGQGLTTTATKDDWEEINFEFKSATLTDGYPSLLRLAELLHQNAGYRVTLDGNTDSLGSDRYNDKLATARAGEVKSFLVKYGADQSQIVVVVHGKRQPKTTNESREGRFMNRRVAVTVADAQGKVVSAGGVGDAIKAMQAPGSAAQKRCCEEVLKRLDKLDEILAAIKDLKSENDRLKQDVAALKQGQSGVEKQVAELPRPPAPADLQRMMETSAEKAIDKAKPSRFSLLGVNLGPSLASSGIPGQQGRFGAGSITFTGKARYFAPFGRDESHALQAEGEYMYYRDRQEGQFDLGLVNRWSRVQAGVFSSLKHVGITGIGGGTLGQAAFTADVLFSRGRFGFFGTKSYLDDRTIGRLPVYSSAGVASLNHWTEYYLKVVDQVGASAQVALWSNAYVEGNMGALFRSSGGNRPGGTVRLVQPFSSHVAGTIEASLNETMLANKNSGRVAFGVQFGNWVRPKDFAVVRHPVPVDVPRLRYEVLTRDIWTAHNPPVADAGGNQIGVQPGPVTLDASASYSPDGLALTYEWIQTGGPAVTIANANAAKASFTAAAGQTYQFRVLVKDTFGMQATGRTMVTTAKPSEVRIIQFAAAPASIKAGETSTLSWQVENADSVEITSIGMVDPKSGSAKVVPSQTTTYTLTARNAGGSTTTAVTVTVAAAPKAVRIVNFQANPATVALGGATALSWQTENADTVTISGIGAVSPNGSVNVSPDRNTTYTLTASNQAGQTTASVTVTVTGALAINSFTASPATISAGQSTTLTWVTQGSLNAYITGVGIVSGNGSVTVSPSVTTTYTLRISGHGASVPSKDVTVTVIHPMTPPTAVIAGGGSLTTNGLSIYLDASPSLNPGGGKLSYQWTGPAGAEILSPSSVGTLVNVSTAGTYTFSVAVTDSQGQSSTANVSVTFAPKS